MVVRRKLQLNVKPHFPTFAIWSQYLGSDHKGNISHTSSGNVRLLSMSCSVSSYVGGLWLARNCSKGSRCSFASKSAGLGIQLRCLTVEIFWEHRTESRHQGRPKTHRRLNISLAAWRHYGNPQNVST